LSLLNFLPFSPPSQPFLAATLDFTSFFTTAFLEATHFFYSWAVFGLDRVVISVNHTKDYVKTQKLLGKWLHAAVLLLLLPFPGCCCCSCIYLSLFYSGRVLNRFSKDIGFIDALLPFHLLEFFTVSVKYQHK